MLVNLQTMEIVMCDDTMAMNIVIPERMIFQLETAHLSAE